MLGLLGGDGRPVIRGEEADRALEVAGVEEEGPGLVARGDGLARGGGLGVGEGEGEVAVAEQLAACALFQVESIGRPEDPGAELGDTVDAEWFVPVPAFAGPRSVGPLVEVEGDAAHDELGSLGGEACVTPPAEAALDIGIEFLGLGLRVLGEHPGAKEAGLEAVAWVFVEQGPGGDIHGEAGVVGFGHLLVGHEEVAGHFPLDGPGFFILLCGGEKRSQGQQEQGLGGGQEAESRHGKKAFHLRMARARP